MSGYYLLRLFVSVHNRCEAGSGIWKAFTRRPGGGGSCGMRIREHRSLKISGHCRLDVRLSNCFKDLCRSRQYLVTGISNKVVPSNHF